MGRTSIIAYEPLRSINSTGLTGAYQKIGTPLVNSASIVKLVNNSTSLVTVSTDGVTDMDVCPSNSFFLYDITTDSGAGSALYFPQGTQFWVNGGAGTGIIYLVVLYNPFTSLSNY